jgi:predicted transcriptional regulator of viral defense system
MKCGIAMRYDLLEHFDQIPYFTIAAFKQVIDVDESRSQLVREMLSRWVNSGHIIRLKRGTYMTRRFYELHRGEASFAPAVSAILVPQSYVSLEYMLQRLGVLTEITYPTTAVTTKNTRKIENILGVFDYRHIKPPLYIGFSQSEFFGVLFNLGRISKALFDYFYFRPLPRSLRIQQVNLAEYYRLNLEVFSTEDISEFEEFTKISGSEKMAYVYNNLRSTWWLL